MFQTKVVEKIKHILYSINFSENCAVNERMWKNFVELDSSQMTVSTHSLCMPDN